MKIGITIGILVAAQLGLAPAARAQPGPPHDPLPHELRPADWPQPDYFTMALGMTKFKPGQRFAALKLAAGITSELLVLPVQTQAFGWTPAINALVGARLDDALAAQGWQANRQTDVFDADGPSVRSFAEAEVVAFAKQHPAPAGTLALHLGRSGDGKAFLTLVLRRGDQRRVAHRSVDEKAEPMAVYEALAATLPGLLSELGLNGHAAVTPAPPRGCDSADWRFDDLPPGATRAARTCRALLLGVLLPEFEWPAEQPRLKTPAKLSWLAAAFVGAESLPPAVAAAARTVVWSQTDLGLTEKTVAEAVDVNDPVVRPLARLLWSRLRNDKMPVASRTEAAATYADAAANGLPPLARAVFIERARFQDPFRPVDLCALEGLVPALKVPAECTGLPPAGARAQRPASRAEIALLDEWRLARAYKDLTIAGIARGDAAARQQVLDRLPARIAAHPLMRQQRFVSERFDRASGDAPALLRHVRASVVDFVQTTADLQQRGSVLGTYAANQRSWMKNAGLFEDPAVESALDDEQRLLGVLGLDGFGERGQPPPTFALVGPWNYFRPAVPGSRAAVMQQRQQMRPSPPPSVTEPAALQAKIGQQPLFDLWPAATLLTPLDAPTPDMAERSQDMNVRVRWALSRAKAGGSVADAVALIDGRSVNRRSDAAIEESHAWALPAQALFYAGEVGAARKYYERVAAIGTGSESHLVAQVRLRQIAGDWPGAAAAAQARLRRYDSDAARGEAAGFAFMTGSDEAAWAMLQPRLATSVDMALWTAVEVGKRRSGGQTARQLLDGLLKDQLGQGKARDIVIGHALANHHIADDRRPSDDDIALLVELGRRGDAYLFTMQAHALLLRAAFDGPVDAAGLARIRKAINDGPGHRNGGLKPLYAWVAAQSGAAQDATLVELRRASLDADLDALLAKAVLLGLGGQPRDAVAHLRAARFELAGLGIDQPDQMLRSAPYLVALSGALLFRKTGLAAYRDETLPLVRAYQRVTPYLAWPHALEAWLAPEDAARRAAACRAKFLDAGSWFLKLSGLPDAPCKTPPW